MAASETSAKEFTIARTLNASRELVWKAWTEREALEEWWGPKGCPIEVEELDVKPGEKFHYSMRMPDGSVWWGVFYYREVEKPSRLVFVNSFSNENGEIIRAPFSGAWPKEVYNVVTFTEKDGKTLVSLRGHPINATAEESSFFESMFGSLQQGFGGTFEQLEFYLASH
ncbi:MAG: SRPBCC domain-containing protein [Xanthobacteraceae bacterium]|nr:SRPBCC domain-containing protein [Xanthobacteraceae bacterium]